MARHSVDQADLRWVSLLEGMNGKLTRDETTSVPVPVRMLLPENFAETTHTRHRADTPADAALVWVMIAAAHVASLLDDVFRSLVARPHDVALVIVPTRTCRRFSDDTGAVWRRLQRDRARRPERDCLSWASVAGATSRHVLAVALIVSLSRPGPSTLEEPDALVRPVEDSCDHLWIALDPRIVRAQGRDPAKSCARQSVAGVRDGVVHFFWLF